MRYKLELWYSYFCLVILYDDPSLDLLHSGDVGGLDVVLILLDLSLELIGGNLLILDDNVDLELLDTVTDVDELGGTPNQTVHLDGADVGLELLKVGLVVYKITVVSIGHVITV